MRDAGFGHQVGAARIDLVHQVEALHRGRFGTRQRDGAGIVDADVDAAKSRDTRFHCCMNLILGADVTSQRQRLAAGAFDLLGGPIDGAGQARIGGHRLGGDGDIGAVGCGLQRNGQPDAPAGAGDKKRLSGQGHGCLPLTDMASNPALDIKSAAAKLPAHDRYPDQDRVRRRQRHR